MSQLDAASYEEQLKWLEHAVTREDKTAIPMLLSLAQAVKDAREHNLNCHNLNGDDQLEAVNTIRKQGLGTTQIFVRAQLDGRWENVDIAQLTMPSLVKWLRSRGGHNERAEATVLFLLGHRKDG